MLSRLLAARHWWPLGTIGFVLFVLLCFSFSPDQLDHAQTQKYRSEAAQEHAVDEASQIVVARYTKVLAAVTIALGCISLFQVYFLIKADETARQSADTAARAAKLAADTAWAQGKEASDARVRMHRPRLHVRNVVIDGGFINNRPVSGQFYVSNTGGVRAIILKSHCMVLWNVNGLPMRRPYEGEAGNDPVDAFPLGAGDSTHGEFIEPHFYMSSPIGRDEGPHIYVMGWISYMDDNGAKRRTAFCRQLLHRNGSARFYPVDDPDYEYEE